MKKILIFTVSVFLFLLVGTHLSGQIVNAEYFWDTDPGLGLGSVLNASDGALDEAIEELLKDPTAIPGTAGIHTFNIRIRDGNGNWGPVFSSIVSVEDIIPANDKKIIQAEYFWDTDPGQGTATQILALDGALDEALEIVFNGNVSQPS